MEYIFVCVLGNTLLEENLKRTINFMFSEIFPSPKSWNQHAK